ncbi:MAG: YcjF family protein [Geminicoccales bacterium]
MTGRDHLEPFELDPRTLDPARIELVEPDASTPLAPLAPEPPPPRSRAWLRLFLTGLGLFVLALLGLEAYQYIDSLFETSPALGTLFTALLVLIALGALGMAWRELSGLMRLATVDQLRADARRLIGSQVHGQAEALLGTIEGIYGARDEVQPRIARFRAAASDALNDGERLRLFATMVLEPLDRQGYRLVTNAARDIGALTALSPLGLLDGFIVLGRTMAMLRAIARLYGVRPGLLATLSLLRGALRNVLAAGVGDLVSDAAVETIGASLLSVLSARAGQGVVNGLLAAKLGLGAMQLCRPLPFTEDEMPSLRQLRAEIFERAS